ncbi:MAG: DNA internalization-related competence protein ComEC/Rec2 [Gammaproteobacteria bacterium]|nr:DNA internalization-related competence protein ComEC/Rec2 [Gammaproteobacteria bacterium]
MTDYGWLQPNEQMTNQLQTGKSLQLHALSFLLGIILLQFFANLPSFYSFFLVPVFIVLAWYRPIFRYGLVGLAGFCWVLLDAYGQSQYQLDESLIGENILIQGRIADIPTQLGRIQRFVLELEQIKGINPNTFPSRIRLSWYDRNQPVKAGEHWQLMVRLKPPHGFMNPGGFDYERWLYQNRIDATGYVRKSEQNKLLAPAACCDMDRLRQSLSESIQQLGSHYSGLIAALAVGDKSHILDEQWVLLRNTGTNHLMAISGLHIGLVAGFIFWLVRQFSLGFLIQRISRDKLAALISIVAALSYALLAGFAIPTQRALIMLLVILGGILLGRQLRPGNSLALALIAVLLADPRSALSPGFWFSFMAVAVITYSFSGRLARSSILSQWGRLQWVIAVALFPVSLFLFQQASLIAPLANLLLVPWVSFLVVPLVLLGMIWLIPVPVLGEWFLNLAQEALDLIWPVLQTLGGLSFASWQQPAPSFISMMLAVTGAILLLAPRGLPLRPLGILMWLPVLLIRPATPDEGDFQMHLLDVGQGLAVFIQTHNHSLLFDTGARFSDNFDAGDRVVVPFMKSLGLSQLDRLVVSHGDNDHKGGAQSIIDQLRVVQLQGQDIADIAHMNADACHAGQSWEWDGVKFEYLHPDREYPQRNNRACVLKIGHGAASLLLTADIEASVEYRLVGDYGEQLASDVLVVPHHGSKTSSTLAFLERVRPDYALVSAGYRNRFRHPRPDIIERYRSLGAEIMNTAVSGAISIYFDDKSGISVPKRYRNQHHHYWNHNL